MFSRLALRTAAAGGFTAAGVFAAASTVTADTGADFDACRKDIADILDQDTWDDGSLGPIFVRLAWHSSGSYCAKTNTGGSNGATMRFEPELKHGGNAGLDKAHKWLETIKAKHPAISYADLWVLAGCVAIEEMGGPKLNFRSGRTDSADDCITPGDEAPTPDGRLPDGDKGAQHLRDIFYRQGFNDQEIVALSGAHAMGRCHTDRSGFDGPWTRAPTTFSNEYFRLLFEDKWTLRKWDGPIQFENADKDLMMLATDMALTTDPEFRKHAEAYKNDSDLFEKDFKSACEKLFHNGFQPPMWKRYLFGAKYV